MSTESQTVTWQSCPNCGSENLYQNVTNRAEYTFFCRQCSEPVPNPEIITGLADPDAFNLPNPTDLRAMRERAGLSRVDVAEHVDVGQMTVYRYEQPENERMRTDIITKLLALYRDETGFGRTGYGN